MLSKKCSYSEELYEIFTSIKYKSENFINFQSLWQIVESKTSQNYADVLLTKVNLEKLSLNTSIEEINNRAC